MKWILLIILYNGNDGGHVTTTQIPIITEKVCNLAKKQTNKLYHPKKNRWFRKVDSLCIKVK